ncbi:TetR/AcrR family transcriptional regulator C-terminal domain-containing protein [Nonomuraea basaltis]|uniref:TetR/AcrR family transcriptional regulator C-terminal domain-containing protein n=1 Tax=Nonomuraea basaltis TaxID=2495887 RepID=UPI00110C6815|nr:TetR/AcrR family transcriptional regulator C-terminal domain-containing protein [Nonomuraea basaltis]TMR89285.1 hypothetical protein EJK15_61640 [Nonomuraea basaltis]
MTRAEGRAAAESDGTAAGPAEAYLTSVARAYLAAFRDPDRVSLLRILLAEGPRNPKLSRAFVGSAVEAGSDAIAEHLAALGFGEHDELVQTARSYMGMLFSWVVLNRLLIPAADPGRRRVRHGRPAEPAGRRAASRTAHGRTRRRPVHPGNRRRHRGRTSRPR